MGRSVPWNYRQAMPVHILLQSTQMLNSGDANGMEDAEVSMREFTVDAVSLPSRIWGTIRLQSSAQTDLRFGMQLVSI